MGGNTFGTALQITTFGESHGETLGVVLDGIESDFLLDISSIQAYMDRRRPGGNPLGTERNESDRVKIVSGLFEGVTTGTPLTILIENTNQRSNDYQSIASSFRPGHADFTYMKKYGIRDYRGGGRSSGRETAARVAAGAVAIQLLELKGITITSYTIQIGPVIAKKKDLTYIPHNVVHTVDPEAAPHMEREIIRAKQEGDSVGGIVECVVHGLPYGLGEPVFNKTEALLAHAILSIGSIKGIEFGDGFACASMRGSEMNDPIRSSGFLSNHAGGILGGITNGEPIIFRAVVKPTPSIAQVQKTIDVMGNEQDIMITGRHDPCICMRILPVIEAMTALTILSLWYEQYGR